MATSIDEHVGVNTAVLRDDLGGGADLGLQHKHLMALRACASA